MTAAGVYEDETFFSIFAEQGLFYEIVADKLRDNLALEDNADQTMLDLQMRRLRYVISRPTSVWSGNESSKTDPDAPPMAHLSILKQCVLLNDQKSRVSMYKMADFFDFDITDYISCTSDLNHVI